MINEACGITIIIVRNQASGFTVVIIINESFGITVIFKKKQKLKKTTGYVELLQLLKTRLV